MRAGQIFGQRGKPNWEGCSKPGATAAAVHRTYFSGEILSKDFDCNFGEVAAADQVVEVRF